MARPVAIRDRPRASSNHYSEKKDKKVKIDQWLVKKKHNIRQFNQILMAIPNKMQ